MEKKIKVGIIEDDPDFTNLVRAQLKSSDKMECVIYTSSVESFFKYTSSLRGLDVLILDIDLPEMSGIDAIPKIKSKFPELKIIMMTIFADDQTIFKALRLGACGFLLKSEAFQQIESKIMSIENDGAPLSPNVAKRLINFFNPPKGTFAKRNRKSKLTPREKMVLNILLKGLKYQEIADEINVSINSVRSHVRSIYKKLNVNSRFQIMEKYGKSDFDNL